MEERLLVKKNDFYMLLLMALSNAQSAEEAAMLVNGYMEGQSEKTKKEFLEHMDRYARMVTGENADEQS